MSQNSAKQNRNTRFNEYNQPIGEAVANWNGSRQPNGEVLDGHYCRLEMLDVVRHAGDLVRAFALDAKGQIWTYMASGPFETEAALTEWIAMISERQDPLFYAIVDKETDKVSGVASYMRITPDAGSIEVGSIAFSPLLQRTRSATEAMFLMMSHAFEQLGYRRYEWKCDSLNAASRRAAERFGFIYEGTFRQALVYKGRNRDTSWFSILDSEWPAIKAGFVAWLDPSNFDDSGLQRQALAKLIAKQRG